MKLLLDNLIPNRYYKYKEKYDDSFYYCKFEEFNGIVIYFYNFTIEEKNDKYTFYNNSLNFFNIEWFQSLRMFEEVENNNFMECLPDDHIDKISYLRKQKINYLLKSEL